MVRWFTPRNEEIHGNLLIEPSDDEIHSFDVYYIAPPGIKKKFGPNVEYSINNRPKILRTNYDDSTLTMFPINTTDSRKSILGPKYDQIEEIILTGAKQVVLQSSTNNDSSRDFVESFTFEEDLEYWDRIIDKNDIETPYPTESDIVSILESLPSGFTKDYDFGLGLAKRYRIVIDILEKLTDCTRVLFVNSR